MTLVHDFLGRSASARPDRPAILADGRSVTFAALDDDSDRLACDLQRGGAARGDRVALWADNVPETVAAFFGILKAGGVAVLVSPLTRPQRLAELLAGCGARSLVAGPSLGDAAAAAALTVPCLEHAIWAGAPRAGAALGSSFAEVMQAPRARPRDPGLIDQDLCAIVHTSGSTGRARGVMLTHRNLVNTTAVISAYLGNVPDDVVTCVLPLSHSYGLCQVLAGALAGYSVVLERSFAYPYDVLRRAAEHRVTGLSAVPTVFAQILQMAPLDGLDLSSLRYLTNAAAPLPPAHLLRLQAMLPGARIFPMYGLTECTRACYLDPARVADRPDSVGRAIANSEAYVVDERGRRAGPGVVGELVVRGSNVMRGYWGMPTETAEVLRDGEIPGEKVLHSGDLFRTDAEGLLYFVGRRDDVFKCKGEKVSPREIESVLCELDDVVHAAVVGVDDPLDGRAIKAAVVLREGASLSESDLRRHCRRRLESYMVPRFLEIRDSLPRTENGKLDRRALAQGTGASAGGHG